MRNIIIMMGFIVLVGCSSYKNSFPTKPDRGLGTAGAYEIKEIISQDRLEEEIEIRNDLKHKNCLGSHKVKCLDSAKAALLKTLLKDDNRKIKVFIPAHIDMQGDFEESRIIYTGIR